MSTGSKPSTARILDPVNATLNGQAKVNAEIFTAVEILGRKLERVEAERDRLARRLALIESAATLDEKTGKYYLPVVVDRDETPPVPATTPKWMIAASLMSSAVALFSLGLVLFREPPPALTKDQLAVLESLRVTQFAQLSPESKSWKDLGTDTAAASTPRPSAQLPDNNELAKLEQSAEALNNVEPAAAETTPPEATSAARPLEAPKEETTSLAPSPAAETQTASISAESKASEEKIAQENIPEQKAAEEKVTEEKPQAAPSTVQAAAKPVPVKPAVVAARKMSDADADASLTGKLAELQERALKGVPEAQHDLATIYAAGTLVPQDYKRATYWFTKAADNGVANAHYNLGVIYHQGLGVAVNLPKALNWYQKAAELGHPEALYNLGIAYIEGIGTKADTEKGVSYFKRAAKAGVAQAAYNLGVLYESNFIGAIDTKKAIEWYRMAAKQGHAEARNALARLNGGSVDNGEQAMTLAETVEPAAGASDEEIGEGDSSPVSKTTPQRISAPKKPAGPQGTLADIQRLLIKQGILPGKADGVLNQQTEDAIRAAQSKLGMVEDGQPSQELLEKLLQKPPLLMR